MKSEADIVQVDWGGEEKANGRQNPDKKHIKKKRRREEAAG